MNRKSKVFAFCIILIIVFFLPLTHTVRGGIDVKKDIIGKWEQNAPKHKASWHDPKDKETIVDKETIMFLKSGSVAIFRDERIGPVGGLYSARGGYYRIIGNNHVRLHLGPGVFFWGSGKPFDCKFFVSKDKLILTLPDGKVEEYQRVASKAVPSDRKILKTSIAARYVVQDTKDKSFIGSSFEFKESGALIFSVPFEWKIEGNLLKLTHRRNFEWEFGRILDNTIAIKAVPGVSIVKQEGAKCITKIQGGSLWSEYIIQEDPRFPGGSVSSSLEFKKDGTVMFPEETGEWETVGNTIRFRTMISGELGGTSGIIGGRWSEGKIKGNIIEVEDIIGVEDGFTLVKQTAVSSAHIDEAIEIKEQIEKRLKMLNTTKYTYLLDTDSVKSAISTTWLHLTSPLRGGNLIERYNEFFYTALDYQNMAVTALQKARLSLDGNNISTAQKYVKEADRYIKLADLSNDAAIRVFQGEVDSAAKLAEGIYKGSKASVKYGGNIILGPWGSKVSDGLFLATDFAIDMSTKGLNEAAKNAIQKATVIVIFDEIKIKSLGDKTISDILTKSSTKVIGDSRLYSILDDILKNPEVEKALMGVLAKSAAFGVREWSKEQGVKFIKAFQEELREIASPKVVEERKYKLSEGAKPQITSSLRILEPPPYNLGQTITAEFSIKNIGTASITFDVLTVGGRVNGICPQDICPDFTWKENITLQSNEIYPYNGKLKLEAPGNYHFFTAYRTTDGWNTSIPTAIGVTNTKDIVVEGSLSWGGIFGTYIGTYTNPSAHPGKGEARIVKSKLDLRKDNTFLMGILGKWKIKVGDEPDQHVKVIIAPEWHGNISTFPNFIGYIEGDNILDMDTNKKLIKQPRARPLTGYIKGGIVRDAFEGKLLKQLGGRLWSTYIGEKKEMFLEFKEDETAFFGGFGKWEIKGDTLTLYVKDPEGKEESTKGKIKGNTITLEKMVFVKYE